MEITVKGLEELTREFRLLPQEIARATRNAVNTTATEIRKVSIDEAFKTYHIKNRSRLNKDSTGRNISYILRARMGESSASIRYIGGTSKRDSDRLGLQNFKTDKQERNIRRTGWQPSFKIRRNESTKKLERGFYGVGKLKGQGLFQRKLNGRKLTRRTGPGLKLMVESQHILPSVVLQGQSILTRHIISAVEMQIKKRMR
jgi:hypothetical protein